MLRGILALCYVALITFTIEAGPPARTFTPEPASVQWCGPAYRYPQAGWIVIHIEGKPYDRGYQYGTLMAKEIAGFAESIGTYQSTKAPSDGWRYWRAMADALFLRRYNSELLEEMKGIADGAAASGAKIFDRAVDLVDIVTINSDVELNFVENALSVTPTGLEGRDFKEPPYARKKQVPMGHCSAFAATGPATKDGQIVLGHITMWNLYHSRWYNVWLDVKPEQGHRIMLQTYPGGIMSGLDYYQNDKGLLLSETTISQTRYHINGTPLTQRCRLAIQYASTVDECVAQLNDKNNGLYTNEWLIADTKTNEIAMFEMGTTQTKLWRSSKNEWPGNTPGFYWGCNNTKDLQVRLETQVCLDCKPANMTFRPSERDKMWLKLYDENKGTIDEAFAFKAFTTPPLAAYPSLDVKFTTTALAKEFKSWGLFGPPLGRSWEPTEEERQKYDGKIYPLISNDWTILSGKAPEMAKQMANDVKSTARPFTVASASASSDGDGDEYEDSSIIERNPAWNGTLLPKSDADVWLTAGFADYERIVSKLRQKKFDKESLNLALYAYGVKSRQAAQRLGKEIALNKLKLDPRENDSYDQVAGRGVLVLHQLRELLGGNAFDGAMNQFGKAHAGKEVTTSEFRTHMEKATGKSLEAFFSKYVDNVLPYDPSAPRWSIFGWEKDIGNTIIIYGTQVESAANREAAQRLQDTIARRWGNFRPTIKSDREITDSDLQNHLLLIGRPEANSITAKFAGQFPITQSKRSFSVNEKIYASDQSGIIVAGAYPEKPNRCIVAFMGLGAESTWKLVNQMGTTPCDALVMTSDGTAAKVLKQIPFEQLVRHSQAR